MTVLPSPTSDSPPSTPITRFHRTRLMQIWRSAGWPCKDGLEIDLLAAGLIRLHIAPDGCETLRLTDTLREMINQRAPGVVLRQKAIELGMRTLREEGLDAIFAGETSVEEILKYT